MLRTRYLFTPASLEYLRKGGRIGTASALLGQVLQICPILTVENGETATYAKVRTRARALTTITEKFAAEVSEFGLRRAVVHYISDKGVAERFAAEAIEPIVGSKVPVLPVSPSIGVHVGPAVAVAYETQRPLRARV
jgi:DegV family protein with EDD domain